MTPPQEIAPAVPDPRRDAAARRRRAWLNSLAIASIAAFAGGVAVVGVQYLLSHVSAGYPPAIHALTCRPESADQAAAGITLDERGIGMPMIQLASGTAYLCRLEAPSADYASWSLFGPVSANRSGPLDTTLPCQSAADFANQDPGSLRLSPCQRIRTGPPGLYLLSVKVMVRGQQAVDRAAFAIRVLPADGTGPAIAARRSVRLAASLGLPARLEEQLRDADLAASFSEHGLLPQSRRFVRTVYRLAPDEEFVSAAFQARSAAHASTVQVAYVPQSRSVTASFTLRSGPLIDRYRGWVSGTVVVRVRRQEAAREIALPEATLELPGRSEIPLPDGLETADARVLLRRRDAEGSVELAPGMPVRFEGHRLTARFTDTSLVLEAVPE